MTRSLPEGVVATRQHMLRMMPPHIAVVAELGVFAGDWAAQILRELDPKELHLFDSWVIGNIACGDQDGQNVVWRDAETLYEEVQSRFARDSRVSIYRMPTGYIRSFRPGTFDLVYVDADHAERAVMTDLLNAEAVIAHDGIIAGHDYGPMFPGVMRAVDAFCRERPWKMWLVTEDGCPSYALRRR